MGRPRIGLTSSAGDGTTTRVEKVGRGYLDALTAAGGLPTVLPTLDPSLAADALAGVDALLLTGGGDVEPSRYGAIAEPETGDVDPARDAWELELVALARAAGLPILGICRGAQVVNVAFGGTLVQHLGHRTSAEHTDLDRAAVEVHDIAVEPGSLLRSILGADAVRANTIHHQAVDVVGDGLVVSGRADDGIIEAIELADPAAAPVLAVQWHPELLADRDAHRALFTWIVHEASHRA